MEHPLTLTFTQTLPELMHACRLYQRSTAKHRIYQAVGVFALLLAVFLAFNRAPLFGVTLLVILGLFLLTDPLPPLVMQLGYRGSVALREPYRAVFDADGIALTIAGKTTARPWGRVQRLLESETALVPVYGSWTYSVIPLRNVSPEQRAQIRALWQQHRGS